MAFTPKFNVGDHVIRRNGKKVAIVKIAPDFAIYTRYTCRYIESGQVFIEDEHNLKAADLDEQSQNMKTLYSFTKEDGSTGYGTHIGTNSQNLYLIEEKGTGAILVFDKDKLEEVLPYTFSVKIGNSETHYHGEKGAVSVNDYVVDPQGRIGVVTGVGTKNKSARSKFKGVKLHTYPLS